MKSLTVQTKLIILLTLLLVISFICLTIGASLLNYSQTRTQNEERLKTAMGTFQREFDRVIVNDEHLFHESLTNILETTLAFKAMVLIDDSDIQVPTKMIEIGTLLHATRLAFYYQVEGYSKLRLRLYYDRELGGAGQIYVENGTLKHRLIQKNTEELITVSEIDEALQPLSMMFPAFEQPYFLQVKNGVLLLVAELPYISAFSDVNYSLQQGEELGRFVLEKPLDLNLEEFDNDLGVHFTVYDQYGIMGQGKVRMPDIDLTQGKNVFSNEHVIELPDTDGNRYDSMLMPLRYQNVTVGYVSANIFQEKTFQKIWETVRVLFLIALVVVVIAVMLLSLVVVRIIAHPLKHMAVVARRQLNGDLNARIQLSTNDEFGQLGQTFNMLSNKLSTILQEQHITITELKQVEEALRESEERFRSIFSQSPIGIELYDKDGHLIDINATCLEMFGVKDVEMVKGFKLFEDPNLPQDAKQRVLNGESVKYEAVFDFDVVKAQNLYETTKSGQCFLESFFTQWGAGTGDLKGFLVHVTDITERKQAEEALRESESMYRMLIEATNSFVFSLDANGDFSFVNRFWTEKVGYSAEEILGKNGSELITSESRKDVEEQFAEVLKGHFVEGIEFGSKTKDKGLIDVLINLTPIYDVSGKVTQIFGTGIDITDRKRAKEQLKNQNLLLEQAVQEKQREMEALFERLLRQEKLATIGQIAGSIAHELRNPLGAVKNSVFFLKRLWQKQQLNTSNPKVQEHLDLIDAELNASEQVIAYLLQMTRMKPVQRVQTNLRSIIEDAAEHCNPPANIQLSIDLPSEPFLIWVDPVQLRQVFINLLINAFQAITQKGSITIRAKPLTNDDSITIELEDTGGGIEPGALNKIFEPLYTTKATGTGLGLSICKQIVEHHQGQISIKSCPGEGTTVTIVLPDQG